MPKQTLAEASQDILNGIVSSKRSQRDSDTKKLDGSVAYGTKEVGAVNDVVDDHGDTDKNVLNYTKGVPQATKPGATPPVGVQPDGVGATKPEGQPQQVQGRTDLAKPPVQADANNYDQIRDRIAGKLANQQMTPNPGSHFQMYGEEIDLTDDVKALLEGETLSDEFKIKATTIFEAAVKSRIEGIVEHIEIRMTDEFDTAVEQIKEELAEKVDSYLNYMVEEWMKDNEVAIEAGLRTEITEEFMSKLRTLFIESYIEIPTEKVDVVEELATKVEDLETNLNEEIKTSIALSEQIKEYKKIIHIQEACDGLAKTQIEKIKSLAESVDFTTDEEFVSKIETIKESYFPSKAIPADGASLNEEIIIEDEVKSKKTNDPEMNSYLTALDRNVQNQK